MKNIDERIKLRFGPSYGLHVAGKAGSGTIVTLVLPAIREGDRI